MKNFQITAKEDNKKYWISRSVCVASFIFVQDNKFNLYILANKRGVGTPDYQGYWNCPCGYIDFDETGNEAAIREIKEETGYNISAKDIKLFGVNTNPKENKQNITLLYTGMYDLGDIKQGTPEGEEYNEVEEVKLINLADLNNYKWAFSHDVRIKQALAYLDYVFYQKYFKLSKI